MPIKKNKEKQGDTVHRILDTAAEVFAESGFAGAFRIIVEPLPQQDWVTDTALFNVGRTPPPAFGTLSLNTTPSGARAPR